MSNNLPMIRKKGIFYNIKEWFKKLFNKDETIEDPIEENNKTEDMNKSVFVDSIKVKSKDTILSLQRKLENKEIEISSLTDQELDEMIKIYEKQIEERQNKIKNYYNIIKSRKEV